MHTFSDDRGWSFMSIFDHVPALGAAQFNASMMYAGAIKAWHRHAKQDDYWVVLCGDLKIGLFNTERSPRTAQLRFAGAAEDKTLVIGPGAGKVVHLGEHSPGILHIPAGVWHGGVAVGGRSAMLLYYVTRKYVPSNPDEERRPWDEFDFDWSVDFK